MERGEWVFTTLVLESLARALQYYNIIPILPVHQKNHLIFLDITVGFLVLPFVDLHNIRFPGTSAVIPSLPSSPNDAFVFSSSRTHSFSSLLTNMMLTHCPWKTKSLLCSSKHTFLSFCENDNKSRKSVMRA